MQRGWVLLRQVLSGFAGLALSVMIWPNLYPSFRDAVPGAVRNMLVAAVLLLAAPSFWRLIDRPVLKELLKAYGLGLDVAGPEYGAILRRTKTGAARSVCGFPVVYRYAQTGRWADAQSLVGQMPLLSRRFLADCLDGVSDRRGRPRRVRLLALLGALRFAFPVAGARSLLALDTGQAVLHYQGRYDDGARVASLLWRVRRDPRIAFNCSCSLAKSGKTEGAVGWVKTATERGYPTEAITDDPDLASIRSHPWVVAIVGFHATAPVDQVNSEPIGPYFKEWPQSSSQRE